MRFYVKSVGTLTLRLSFSFEGLSMNKDKIFLWGFRLLISPTLLCLFMAILSAWGDPIGMFQKIFITYVFGCLFIGFGIFWIEIEKDFRKEKKQ